MRRAAVLLIRLYQRTISFDHGPLKGLFPGGVCKFHPTCSEYGVLAIGKEGLLRGGWKTIKRLSRCHPWSFGGVDLP